MTHGAAADKLTKLSDTLLKNAEDLRHQYLGAYFISDARIFLSTNELATKTAQFMLATGLLSQFAGFKTLSPLE